MRFALFSILCAELAAAVAPEIGMLLLTTVVVAAPSGCAGLGHFCLLVMN